MLSHETPKNPTLVQLRRSFPHVPEDRLRNICALFNRTQSPYKYLDEGVKAARRYTVRQYRALAIGQQLLPGHCDRVVTLHWTPDHSYPEVRGQQAFLFPVLPSEPCLVYSFAAQVWFILDTNVLLRNDSLYSPDSATPS